LLSAASALELIHTGMPKVQHAACMPGILHQGVSSAVKLLGLLPVTAVF